ncbi:MAG: ribonuclease R [Alphaproteobacteria bacterium]|nr:ribonuclease R [Alphaproteobacteria bacterium]
MTKRGKASSAREFPSRDDVAAFIRGRNGEVNKREIAHAFKLGPGDRHALNRLLDALAEDGVIAPQAGRDKRGGGALPAVGVVEVVRIDEDGEAIAFPAAWRGKGPAPHIRIAADRRGGLAPGIGERVLARLEQDGAGYVARVMKRIEARPRSVIGVFRAEKSGGWLEPTDKRLKTNFPIAAGDTGDAAEGELVLCETRPPSRGGGPAAAVVREVIGHIDAPRAASLIAIHTHGIPTDFTDEAVAQAESAEPAPMGARLDLRDVPLVTIDGADARDFDDAVWAAPDDDPENPGGWHLRVAIADVAWYVRPGDALDRCAYERGNSVYFPDRVVPMLPEALSNGLCSLRPDEERACLAVDIRIDAEGRKRRHVFHRAMMRSAVRLTYEAVQAARDAGGKPADALPDGLMDALYGAYAALHIQREQRGTVDLDLPERRAVMTEDGRIERIEARPRYDSHRLIEEFMICANVCAAETLESLRQPCMYRVHDEPAPDRLVALRRFLETLGYNLGGGQAVRPRHFAQLLKKVAGTPRAHAVNDAVLRSQAQAVYSPDNLGHFGLALRRYAHFTSPIRRYSDLLVHRALITGLKLGAGGLERNAAERFTEAGEHISGTERRAMMAERDTMDRLVAAWMEQHIGAEFSGRISGVERFGIFVRLDETGADGLLPASALGPERLRFDRARNMLSGRGATYRLGDAIRVRLAEAAPVTGGLLFAPARDGGGSGGQSRGRKAPGKGPGPQRPRGKPRRGGGR